MIQRCAREGIFLEAGSAVALAADPVFGLRPPSIAAHEGHEHNMLPAFVRFLALGWRAVAETFLQGRGTCSALYNLQCQIICTATVVLAIPSG